MTSSKYDITSHGVIGAVGDCARGEVRGNITLPSSPAGDPTKVLEILAQLREAIGKLEVSANDRVTYTAPVEQAQAEVVAKTPNRARLLMAWGAIQNFGAVESSIQGAVRVQHIVEALAPHIATLLQHLPS